MSYLLNYKNWRAIHEAAIFEQESTQLEKLAPGDATGDTGDLLDKDRLEGSVSENYTTLASNLAKLFLKANIKAADAQLRTTEGATVLLDAAILGSWRKSFSKNSPQTADELYEWLNTAGNFEKFGFKISEATSIELMGRYAESQPGTAKIFYPQKRGTFTGDFQSYNTSMSLKPENRQVLSTGQGISQTLSYINSFNTVNTERGYDDQYKIGDMLDDQNALVFTETKAYPKTLYFYSNANISEAGPSKSTETQIVGGVEAQKGATEIAFKQGSADLDASGVKVDASHPKVAEIGEKIKSYLGEKGVIDKMTLTSSASPEWNGGETMANYAGKTTTGTGAPAPGTDFAAKNADLAYRRGVTFQNALTAYLGGHVKANAITVAWKISTDEPGKGRHIAYDVATKSEAPQAIQVTSFAAGKTSASFTPGKVNEYTLTWNIPTEWMAKDAQKEIASSEEIAKQYSTTKVGYKVKLTSKADPNKIVEVEVSKIEGGQITSVKTADGKELPVENAKDRFKGWTDDTVKMVAKEAKAGKKTTTEADI